METATESPVVPPTMDQQPDAPLVESNSKASDEGNNDNAQNAGNEKNNNKKDRKRRPGLPLPDPIPEEPVKPYPAPSKEEMQKRVDEENVKLQECYSRLNQTRQFMDERQKIRDASRPSFDSGRKELGQLNNECRVMFDERKALSARIKELREFASRGASNTFAELTGAGKDGTEALKDVNNMEDLENRIREYQYRLETESMPILEEKRIVTKISFLTHKGRDYIQQRDASEKSAKAENEARKATRAELEQKRAALDTRIDATKAKMEEKKKELDELRAKQQKEEEKLSSATPEVNRDEERKKITEIRGVIRKLRDDFQDELDKYYLNRRIMAEQQKIARRKKYEALQAEREEKRKAWEAEQAQYPEPHPYQAEKDMCSGLTVYLKTLLGETIDKPALNLRGEGGSGAGASAPSLKANGSSGSREITASGKAIGKSVIDNNTGFEDLAFSDFVKKSKKGRKARKPGAGDKGVEKMASNGSAGAGAVDDENSALKPHSIDYLTAFSKLGIKAPNRLSEVRAALDAVTAKAAFYETAPAPTDEEKKEKAMVSNSGGGKKSGAKKMANGTDVMNGGFPGLGSDSGSGSRGGAARADMPSFKAVASGDASAPPSAASNNNSSVNSAFPSISEATAASKDAEQAADDEKTNGNGAGDENAEDDDGDVTAEADKEDDGTGVDSGKNENEDVQGSKGGDAE